MRLFRIIFLFILMTTSQLGFSQIKNSLFKNYTANDGLIDERAHCIFQDSKGWIWIGTDYGVVRFDGYTFYPLTIDCQANKALSNALVRRIIEDSNGYIWIATELQGFFKYDRANYSLEQFKDNGLSHNSVWDITEDQFGKLWIGTEGGLNYFNPESEQIELTITTQNNPLLTSNWIRRIIVRKNGDIWIGTNNGIAVMNKSNELFTNYLNINNVEERKNEIWDIFEDKQGSIWVGTYLGGLFHFNPDNKHFEDVHLDEDNSRATTVRAIVQDSKGDLWVGTRGGLFNLNLQKNEILFYCNQEQNSSSLVYNSVLSLFVDKKGDLWIGTRNGISFLNFERQAFGYLTTNVSTKNQLNNAEVYVMQEDENHNLWIGTESGGINIYDLKNNTIRYFTDKQGLSKNCIKAIMPDSRGNMLIGTYLGGLNQFNLKTGKNIIFRSNPQNEQSISDNEVWAILKDTKDRVWVGTSKGMDLFDDDKGTFTHYGQKYHLGIVAMIYEDKYQNIWVYSSDIEKMTVIKPDETFQTYDLHTRAICDDDKGNIWLATLGDGLIRYNLLTKETETFTTEQGLCNNILNGIINVNNNFLWLSSNNGLSRFNLIDHTFTNYYNTDGLLNNKFNYGAYFAMSDNILAFGGTKGIDFIYLNKLRRNQYVPPVVLTHFKIFNKDAQVIPGSNKPGTLNNLINETSAIQLSYNQNMISFTFAALNYANNSKNQYKYKLEGFDKDWNIIGNTHTATYTNLDHGRYTLKILGSNDDGVFNNEGLSVNLNILPPFWKTWWFRTIFLSFMTLLFFLIFLMVRNREILKQQLVFERQTARKISELDRLKHQFFMNISHEIRTPLSLIVGPLDKLISSPYRADIFNSNLQIIKRNADKLRMLVNQLLDYRKLETGNLKLELSKGNISAFIEEITESFRVNAEEKQIKFEFKTSHKSIFTWFDPDKAEKITNNLISNALKYTNPGGMITVSVSLVDDEEIEGHASLIPPMEIDKNECSRFVKIQVADTGIGIAPEDIPLIFDRFRQIKNNEVNNSIGSGIGLALTKEMINLHHGHIKVRSTVNKGSRFTVFLPFDDNQADEQARADNDINNLEEHEKEQMQTKDMNRRIALIVDDNKDLRDFIKSHFEPEYHVIEARNGKEGWEHTLERIPDIIVADIMMPVMDGNELCKKIKRDERTSHIPIILLSALTSTENQLAGIDAGADDYLTKPFDIGLLKAKVDNLLSIRKNLRQRYSKEMIIKPKDIVIASPDEKFIKKLIDIIEKNIDKEDLDIDFLSQNLDVSRTQLYRKINALTDMTPKEFVKEIRLKRAAQILVQDKMNISEVAYAIGFNDVTYFRKCFKEKFGMSASDYKKSDSHSI